MTRLLLLAGTAEALALSHRLAALPGLDLVTSLAGTTRRPAAYAGRLRSGGFGGAAGLADYLRDARVDLLIDATHPFATRIGANAAAAAVRTGTPRLRLLRPPWPREPGWRSVPSLGAALDALPAGAVALATTGGVRVEALGRRPDCRVLLRAIEPPAALPPGVRLIRARPPFALEDETALMRAEGITHLVTRNSGGEARARLDAARALSVAVLMIARPPPPPGPTVSTVEAAAAWAEAGLAATSRDGGISV